MVGRAVLAVVGTRYGALDLEEERLRSRPVDLRRIDGDEPSVLSERLQDVDVVLLGSQARLTGELIAHLPRLRGVVRYGIGVDNVDLNACRSRGIPVAYVPDYCLEEVADHTVALILALLRKLVPARDWIEGGGWGIQPLRPLRRISGLTAGLIGFGRIGRAVAKRLKAFGMAVAAYDPALPDQVFLEADVARQELPQLLATSDVLSLHAPLSQATRHLLDRSAFQQVKEGAIVVNTARGALIDEEALDEALTAGRLAGAGLDVLAEEPPKAPPPLARHPNVILTPHAAWYSEESERELREKGLAEALRILDGVPVLHPAW